MLEIGLFLHAFSILLVVGLISFGVGLGCTNIGVAALAASNIQPRAQAELQRLSLLGMALIETAGVLGIIVMFMLLSLETSATLNINIGIAELGIALVIGLTGVISAIMGSKPAVQACYALARQPLFGQKIMNLMLVCQSIIQTPLIFALLIVILIKAQLTDIKTYYDGLKFLAAGIALGLGSIGPTYGMAQFAATACTSIGINRASYTKIIPFTFISMAIIETPIIFALVIALMLAQTAIPPTLVGIAGTFAAACCVGIGTLSAGTNSAKTATAACKQIAYNPELAGTLTRTSIIVQGVIDATAIYALVIGLLLLIFR